MFPDKVFLASKSPRRLELLSFCFGNVEQIQSLRDEPKWNGLESAKDYLKRCMFEKALGADEAYLRMPKSMGWHLVAAADTIVVLSGKVYGKPDSPQAAVEMLMSMMGKEHSVATAYHLSLFHAGHKKEEFAELLETKVRFRKATLAEVKAYVKTGEPLDKSGSYGVQGPALQFVESVEGSYQSVMGIPLFSIQKKCQQWSETYGAKEKHEHREETV